MYYCSGSSKLKTYVVFFCVQWGQANVTEGELGRHTSSSYKFSGSSSSSPSGKYVGNGRFSPKSLYAGSLESLIWGEGAQILLKVLPIKLFKDNLFYLLFIIKEYWFLCFLMWIMQLLQCKRNSMYSFYL